MSPPLILCYVSIASINCLMAEPAMSDWNNIKETERNMVWNISADDFLVQIIDFQMWKAVMIVYDQSSSYFALPLVQNFSRHAKLTLVNLDSTLNDVIFEESFASVIFPPRKECHFILFCNYTNTVAVVHQISAHRTMNNHRNLPDFISTVLLFLESSQKYELETSASNMSNVAVSSYEKSTYFITNVATLLWTKEGRQFGKVKPGCFTQTCLFPNSEFGLNTYRLTVATVPDVPFVKKISNNGTTTYTGICIELLDVLANTFNFTCSNETVNSAVVIVGPSLVLFNSYFMIEPDDGTYGAFVNGSWTGLVGGLVRQEVDLVAALISVEAERNDVIDFTHPFCYSEFELTICNREEFLIQSDIAIAPFQWLVWIAIALVLVVASCLYAVLTSYSAQWWTSTLMNWESTRPTLQDMIWFIIGSFLKQGMDHLHNPVTLTSRTKFAFWSLFAIVVLSFYTSQLVAFLSVKKENFPIKDIEGLVVQEEYTWGIMCEDCVIRNVFENSKVPEFRQFWKGIKKFAATDADFFNHENQLKKMETEKHVYLLHSANGHNPTVVACETTVVGQSILSLPVAFAVPKGSPLLNDLSTMIHRLDANGIITHWLRKWIPKNTKSKNNTGRPQRITVTAMYSAGYILFGGILASTVVLIFEMCQFWRK